MFFSWLEDAARQRPSARALVQGEVYLSYRGLSHRVERRAAELRALGIDEGDWVGLMLGNAVEFVVLAAALDLLGAVAVPLSPGTTDADMSVLLELTPLRVVVSHPRSGGPRDMGQRLDRYNRPVERRRLRGTLLQCAMYPEQGGSLDLPVRPLVAFAMCGPGGSVRVTVRTAENLAAEVENLAMALRFTADDRVASSVGLHTPEGFQAAMLLPLGYGGMLFLEDNMAPRNLVRLVRQAGVTLLPLWPGVLSALSRYAALGVPWSRDNPLRVVSFRPTAGPALRLPHPKVGDRTAVKVLHLPETGTVCFDAAGSGPAVAGTALPGVEIRVGGAGQGSGKRVGGKGGEAKGKGAAGSKGRGAGSAAGKARARARAKGKARAEGKPGEKAGKGGTGGKRGRLWVRGGSVSWFRLESGTAEPVRLIDDEGWADTGCRAKLDSRGRVTLLGRGDDLLELEGAWISLHEVGATLLAHSAVKEVELSVAQAPESGEPLLAARVGASESVDSSELVLHLSRNLSPYKVPAKVEVVPSGR